MTQLKIERKMLSMSLIQYFFLSKTEENQNWINFYCKIQFKIGLNVIEGKNN